MDDDATKTLSSALSHPEPSTKSSSGHVTSLIETLQPAPPPLRSPSHSVGRSLIDALHARTSAAVNVSAAGSSTLADAVLGGVDLSLAAVVLGSSQSPASSARRQPQARIHVTTESPERAAVTSASGGVRPTSGIGRRSAGVPHGSVRAFQQQQQQQQHSGRQVAQQHSTLLVVPSSSSRGASLMVNTRGGSVSTSPSSASPSPSPEPVSRHSSGTGCDCRPAASATPRSLSTSRPLGVTRTPAATDDHAKPSRSCVQRHCDQRQLTAGGQATRTDELQEQETFV